MKRNHPYGGPTPQGQGMSQPSYGQPPPPAGPAPPLPSSGPPQGAYANYGYGSVAPARHAATSLNGGGASHQQQWNQQWQQPQQQQQQQPYYPQPPPPPPPPNAVAAPGAGQFAAPRPPSQPGPYRNMAAPNTNAPSVNQNAAYSPHQPHQSVPYSYQPQASPMQSQSPSQHHQPPAPPAYGYTPPMPPNQNASPSPHNSNAQTWPGAYAPGTQVGPPNKKPRYQAPAANVPAPAAPYGPPGAMPMAPAGGYMAGGAMNQYSPQQQYGWQGPSQAQAQPMHPLPVPGPSVPYGQVPSGGHADVSVQGAQFAHSGRNNMGGKGNGGVGDGGPGRGLNRKGAQNRGNMSQNASGQRAGLPANPNVSVNAARAPNGQTRAWGASGGGIQAGRRVSSASSVHSDKGAVSGPMTKKAIPGSKNMVPPNAPRGPNNARNKATANAPATGSQVPKSGGAAAVLHDRSNQNAAADASVIGSAAAKDSSSSSKRAHTDFRILGLEIKQLDWSWHAPRALAKSEDDAAELTMKASDATQNAEEVPVKAEDEALTAVAEAARPSGHDADAGSGGATSGSKAGATNSQVDDVHEEEHSLEHDNVDEDMAVSGKEDADVGMEADVNDDADADADDDEDTQGHVDAHEDADDNDEEAEHAAEAADADDVEDNVSASRADTETAASERQHSVAATPEPSNESSKVFEVDQTQVTAQDGSKSKANGAKIMAGLRESTKLRLCFAAMSNAGPEGAPTGPKASKVPALKTEVDTQVQDETIAGQTGPEPSTKEDAEAQTAETQAEQSQALQDPEETEIKNEPEETSALQANEVKAAEDSDSAQAGPAVEEALTSKGAEPTDAAMLGADAEVEAAGKVDGKGDGEAEGENEGGEAVEGENKGIDVVEGEEDTKDAEATSLQPGDDAAPDATKVKGLRSAVQSSPQPKGPPQLSLNRIFLSFAANRKRLAIDAEAVKSVKIHRSEHWVEICIDVTRQSDQVTRKKGEEYLVCNGTLLEKRTKGQENYTAVTKSDIAAAWDAVQPDVKPAESETPDEEHLELPPFFRLPDSTTEMVLHVQLDPSAPLPEPAWLRKNDLNELLATLQRGSTAIAGKSDTAVLVATAQHVWTGKIEVMDPDPPPSMSTFLYEWVKESFIGSQKERRKFVDELLGREKKQSTIKAEEDVSTAPSEESNNARDARIARSFVEIVLRLIKGERVPPPPTLAETLASTSYTTSTTYPGLFMLGLLDLSLVTDAARVRGKVDRMLMAFPRAVLLKAVDLTWKDVVESGRKGEAGPVVPVKAAGVVKSGMQGRRHQQTGRQQHHGGAGARHGKRKRG